VVRWREALGAEENSLLFLESIPTPETRVYVKKEMTNFWICRARSASSSPR
jgi:soluble lytic murein transglycosylase